MNGTGSGQPTVLCPQNCAQGLPRDDRTDLVLSKCRNWSPELELIIFEIQLKSWYSGLPEDLSRIKTIYSYCCRAETWPVLP